MAESSFPTQSQSVLSYHNQLWQVSWGETESIAALKEDMSRAVQQSKAPWRGNVNSSLNQSKPQQQAQPNYGIPGNYQLDGYQAVGFMMTSIPGMQCQVPAMVFTAQQEQCPPKSSQVEPKQTGTPQSKVHSCGRIDRATSLGSSPNLCVLGDASPVTLIDDEELPTTFDGELPSIGSEGHFDGSCKRCAFFPKGRCKNGKDCTHCHFAHQTRSRLRKRARKGANAEDNASAEHELVEVVMPLVPGHESEDEHHSDSDVEPGMPAIAGFDSKDELGDSIFMQLNNALREVAEAYKSEDEHRSDSDVEPEKPAIAAIESKEELVEDPVTRLNNALRMVAETYMSDVMHPANLPSEKLDDDMADVDTNVSVSALSDGEESATMSSVDSEKMRPSGSPLHLSKKRTASETSDSEISSSQETTVGSPQSDQEESAVLHKPSWSSMRSNRKAGICTLAEVARITRSLLNKLTEERFESLCSKVLSLPISTTEQLGVVVAEIFEKATTEDCFRSLYTELCMRLDAHLAPQTGAIGGKAFRKALITECQATFERNLKPADSSIFVGLNDEECFEAEMKLKTRRLGNMRFIGDLLVRRLLATKLLPPIVHELLSGDEAALESLMALLTVVAPEFEMKPSMYQAPLRVALTVLRQKSDEKGVCSRIRCQIKDVLEAKARGWAPRSATA